MLSRRDFIKMIGSFAVILTPINRLLRQTDSSLQIEEPPDGELFAGFLLLPEDAPLPNIIKKPKFGIPNECGIGLTTGMPENNFFTLQFNTMKELAQKVDFPIYRLDNIQDGMKQGNISLIKTLEQDVYLVSTGYEVYNPATGIWECSIWIVEQTDFPYPVPIWQNEPVEPDVPGVLPEKVDFLPEPGVMVKTQSGYVFHWIESDILHTIVLESEDIALDGHLAFAQLQLTK
jgi:hypothetical protein